MHDRLSPTYEKFDQESQCGFRPKRGTQDGIFTLKLAHKKQREHGLESWVYFLDLVKAFDRLPRKLLRVVLAKLGVAPKLIRVLKILRAVFKVRFNIDGIEVMLDSIIGVKQGDIESRSYPVRSVHRCNQNRMAHVAQIQPLCLSIETRLGAARTLSQSRPEDG